jgi:putative RNA 2'-phosphotransferase
MRSGRSDRNKNTSKFISLILRHKPETIGITLDEHGWADVRELIDGINQSEGHTLDMEILEEIVRTDEKQRYSFNEDHTLIRANQGHSIPVDVELEEKTPPDILWPRNARAPRPQAPRAPRTRWTGEKYVASIDAQGLIPKSRLYVHLSSDKETAKKVGSRHGRPVIYEIDCRQMAADGYRFFESANHVWLTKEVPVRYLRKL